MSGRWFALTRSEEIEPRHVAQSQLLGQELALWRDDDGRINVWENRCPHRGVRLSLGCNLGATLRCQYHGWQYASGSGRCTVVPAHPQLQVASGYRVRSFRSAERFGLVWTTLSASPEDAAIDDLGVAQPVTLRSTFIDASVRRVRAAMLQGIAPADTAKVDAAPVDASPPIPIPRLTHPYRLETTAPAPERPARLILLLQPVAARQTLIHAVLAGPLTTDERLATLRAHTARFNALRDRIEGGAQRRRT